MGSVKWDEIKDKWRRKIEGELKGFSKQYISPKPVSQNIKVRTFFFIPKMLHKYLLKNEDVPSADNQPLFSLDMQHQT